MSHSNSEARRSSSSREQARLTDGAYQEAVRLVTKHRAGLDRLAQALLEKETLVRDEMQALLADVEPESQSSEAVGRVVPLKRMDDELPGRSEPS